MKRQALNAQQDCSFWLYATCCEAFLKTNDSVKSSLQKWIIYNSYVIQSTIANDYIKVKFDDRNRGLKTEPHQKVILQVSGHELHIDIPNKTLLRFPWYMKKIT